MTLLIMIIMTLVGLFLMWMPLSTFPSSDDSDGCMVFIVGVACVICAWTVVPINIHTFTDKPREEIRVLNLHRTTNYVSYVLEIDDTTVITKYEAVFVNNDFTVYKKFRVNWYGTESYIIEYGAGN
jgi:hypothetical protein